MPQVKSIERSEVMKVLKDCPEIVKDYIKALERANEGWKRVNAEALKKIRELSKQLNEQP